MLAKIPGGARQQAGSQGIGWFFQNTFEAFELPQHVRNGLAGQKFTLAIPAEYLAMADKIHDTGKAAKVAGTIANVDADDKLKVGAVRKTLSNDKRKPQTGPRLKAATDIKCRYHVTFGETAYRCGVPHKCTMKDKIKPKKTFWTKPGECCNLACFLLGYLDRLFALGHPVGVEQPSGLV